MSYSVDLQDIADQLDFDIEDVEMLMEVFLDTANESLSNMKLAIENNNYEEIFRLAHSIKGGAANITFTEISKIAQDIELQAKEKNNINYLEKYEILDSMISNIKISS